MDEFEPEAFKAAEAAAARSVPGGGRGVPPEPGLCQDYNERCAQWAAAGECTKNPGYMVGVGTGLPGA